MSMDARTRMEDVEVRHGCQYGNGPDIFYGQALTGYPIHRARIMEAPHGQQDIDWIDNVLATRIAPGTTSFRICNCLPTSSRV